MKTIKNVFLYLISIILLVSCKYNIFTGGNESIIGNPTAVDYMPFSFIVGGLITTIVGYLKYKKIKSSTNLIITFIGLIVFSFGFIVYFS